MAQLPEPKAAFKHFLNVTQIPRGSNQNQETWENSKKILAALTSWAKSLGYEPYVDSGHNIVIRKPASKGCESAPVVCVQCHMDMVTQADDNTKIDFLTEPLTPWIEDNTSIRARGTSLGADNGIGIGTAFAILEDKTLVHGPLEILITRDEETGMFGAQAMEKNILKCKYLINIDSEEEKSVCLGCAGGFVFKIYQPIQRRSIVDNTHVYKTIDIRGFLGGHSGCDIHCGHANSLMIMGRLLKKCESTKFQLCSFNGGSAHNTIPRDCTVEVAIPKEEAANFEKLLNQEWNTFKEEYATIEKDVVLKYTDLASPSFSPVNLTETMRLVNFCNHVTFGPVRWSPDVAGLVETSINVAVCNTTDSQFTFTGSCRSFSDSQREWMYTWLNSLCSLAGLVLSEKMGAYPGWKPAPECELAKVMIAETKKAYGTEDIKVYAIHAGLECGLFMGVYPNIECTSIGPHITNPHTPNERLKISSVLPFYKSLLGTLAELGKLKN